MSWAQSSADAWWSLQRETLVDVSHAFEDADAAAIGVETMRRRAG